MGQYKITVMGEATDVMRGTDPKYNYFAWPSLVKTRDGKIVAGASGFRMRHVCPYGKVVLTESHDGGKTYGPLRTVIDTCLDDRDCGLLAFGESGLLVTSFNNSVGFQIMRTNKWADGPDKEETLAHLATIDPMEEKKSFGSTFRVSLDNGKTFGELKFSPITCPHGPSELSNGDILWCGHIHRDPGTHFINVGIQCYELNPYTGAMRKRGEIAPIFDGEDHLYSHEPYVIEMPSGKLVCHIRAQGKKKDFDQFTLYQSVSYDAGVTWSEPKAILGDRGGIPSHMILHSSGLLICTYGYREEPYEIRTIISEDEGNTWCEPITLYNTGGITEDIGYPMSIEVENGELLTAFYCHEAKGTPAMIKQIRWKVEK